MQVIPWEKGLPLAPLAIAAWSVFFRGNPLVVILAAIVFMVTIVLTLRIPDREFYLLAAGQPLVVTVGISDLFAGFLISFLLIVILFAGDLSRMGIRGRSSLLVVPAGTAAFILVFMGMSHVLIPFLALLAIAAGGAFVISVQNRLLRKRYSREVA